MDELLVLQTTRFKELKLENFKSPTLPGIFLNYPIDIIITYK